MRADQHIAESSGDSQNSLSLVTGLRKTPILSSIVKLAERLLRGSSFEANTEEYRQALLVNTFALALAPWGPFYSTLLLVLGSKVPGIGLYFLTLVVLATPLVLRLSRSAEVGAHYLCMSVLFPVFLASSFNGGRGAPGWEWVVVTPTMASLLIGRRGGWIWAVIAMLIIGSFDIVELLGFSWPQDLQGQPFVLLRLVALMGLTFLFLSFGIAYEYLKNIALAQLSIAKTQVEEARKMAEEAASVKGQFLANMSHEIRTPMAGVIGMTELLRETDFDEEQRAHLETVHTAAQSLLRVINDILVYSKVDAGKVELDESVFNLNVELEQIEQLFRIQSYSKDLVYLTHVDPSVPQYIVGDPYRLRQVLVNLIGNAVKFSSVGGAVVVRVAVVSESDSNAVLRFSVSDTGVGIAKEKQAEIFDAFAQASVRVSGEYGGTGLGLSISSKLVQLMGGSISVASKPGIGTVFSFTSDLNKAPEEQMAVELAASSTASTGVKFAGVFEGRSPLRILLAEDTVMIQKLIKHTLEKRGLDVTLALTGRQAVEMLERESFDVVLMDMHMPEMDGDEAARTIRDRELRTGRRIPIIAVTAGVLDSDKQRCFAAGMDDYVSKPIDTRDLLSKIAKYGLGQGTEGPVSEQRAT